MPPDSSATTDIEQLWRATDNPSHKFLHYFPVYEHLFSAYRGQEFTFVEFGVQGGGSLQMWQQYFGPQARIIGVDLNPATAEQIDGFDVRIGDQGDRRFLESLFADIGPVDVVLDDGGHQSFQQILTVECALAHTQNPILVVVEDTVTSFDLPSTVFHRTHSFQRYAKGVADLLTERSLLPATHESPLDPVWSVEFFNGIVAFRADPHMVERDRMPSQFNQQMDAKPVTMRLPARSSAEVVWPRAGGSRRLTVHGRPNWLPSLSQVRRKLRGR